MSSRRRGPEADRRQAMVPHYLCDMGARALYFECRACFVLADTFQQLRLKRDYAQAMMQPIERIDKISQNRRQLQCAVCSRENYGERCLLQWHPNHHIEMSVSS